MIKEKVGIKKLEKKSAVADSAAMQSFLMEMGWKKNLNLMVKRGKK